MRSIVISRSSLLAGAKVSIGGRLSRPAFASRCIGTVSGPDSQYFVLPDHRILGFSEYGNPDGYPLMFFHGFPSSRLEAKGLINISKRRDLRIISPDRPGFGLSTFQKNRTIMDWPADVQALQNHLGLSRFAILGGSGGGPYALACAHSLPRETLSAVGILAGAPPWEAGKKDLLWIARVTHLVAKYGAFGIRLALDAMVAMSRWAANTPQGSKAIENILVKLEKGEQSQIPIEDRREELVRVLLEGFAQGSGATVQEALLLTESWGIKFEDVDYDPIQVWHAKDDVNAPISMIRYMVDRLPHAVLQEFEGTHFTIAKHVEEILSQLVPEKTTDPYQKT